MTAGWSPDCKCPACGRQPNIGFPPEEVRRAKRERQAARVTAVKCVRCSVSYWVLARDIANAKPPTLFILLSPGTAAALRKAGLTTEAEVEARIRAGTITEVRGISDARRHEIQVALDAKPRGMVA